MVEGCYIQHKKPPKNRQQNKKQETWNKQTNKTHHQQKTTIKSKAEAERLGLTDCTAS